MSLKKAVFLDRDGVLNRDRRDYVKTLDEFVILPGIDRPIKEIHGRGFLVVVVTNQSAIGRGLITHEILGKIHDKMSEELGKLGCRVDALYYCPHIPRDLCNCRKPQPGLLLRAASELGIDLEDSWLIGDSDSDLEAAKRAGCRGIKVPGNTNGLEIGVNRILAMTSRSGTP